MAKGVYLASDCMHCLWNSPKNIERFFLEEYCHASHEYRTLRDNPEGVVTFTVSIVLHCSTESDIY